MFAQLTHPDFLPFAARRHLLSLHAYVFHIQPPYGLELSLGQAGQNEASRFISTDLNSCQGKGHTLYLRDRVSKIPWA